MSLQTFPRFLELLRELQIPIWRYASKTANAHDELVRLPIYTIADVPTRKSRPSYLDNLVLVLEGPYVNVSTSTT